MKEEDMVRNIVVLLGNPRAELIENRAHLDPQLIAFESGLRFAASRRNCISKYYIAFDHRGIFEQQFIDPRLAIPRTGRKSRIFLSYLLPEIRDVYLLLATQYDTPLAAVSVITEAQSRMEALRLADPNDSRLIGRGCETDDGTHAYHLDHPRVTCTGILAADIHRLARHGQVIVAFWEFNKERCNPLKIHNATIIAQGSFTLPHHITHFIIHPEQVQEFIYSPHHEPITNTLTHIEFENRIAQ